MRRPQARYLTGLMKTVAASGTLRSTLAPWTVSVGTRSMPHRFRSSMRLSPASREAVMVPESQPRDDTGPMSLTATSKATIQERLATIEGAVFSSLPAASDDVRRPESRSAAHDVGGSRAVLRLS